MKLDEFLGDREIEVRKETDAQPDEKGGCVISLALRAQTDDALIVEHLGTVYQLPKNAVLDIEPSSRPMVTRTGVGEPVDIRVPPDTELVTVQKVQAAALEAGAPFSLRMPSQAQGIVFDRPYSERERHWFKERGFPEEPHLTESPTPTSCPTHSQTMSTHWTDTTSPQTWHPRLDNWISDDSNSDGQHPDDSNSDDSMTDDNRADDWV